MKKEQSFNPNLGDYITQLQSVIKVDGRLLRDEDIVARLKCRSLPISR